MAALTGMMRHDTGRHWLPCFLAVERDALQKAGGQMLSCNGLLVTGGCMLSA